MNQTVFTAVLAVILGITSGFPLKTCDKLKGVQKGAENYDLYLVKMKNSKDAEYIVNLVSEYQATLDQHASNVHDPSVRSKLALTEDPGMLHGILSQQALFLVRNHHIAMLPYKPSYINYDLHYAFTYIGVLRKQSRIHIARLSKKYY